MAKSRSEVARTVRWRWMRVVGLFGMVMASWRDLVAGGAVVPFVVAGSDVETAIASIRL